MPAARPPAFEYKKDRLLAESISVEALASRFGTPLYIYSATAIEQRFATFKKSFGRLPHTICYSVKANSNLSILKLLHRMGSGFDVVSGGELERVLRVSKRASRSVVFSGVGKTAAEMDLALRSGILIFNVESEGELHLLAERARKFRKSARIAFRVNPDVSADTHPYISTGRREHKFGVPLEGVEALYQRASSLKNIEVAGVSVHIGSQITSVQPFAEAMHRVAALVRRLSAQGHRIRYVDAGGGLGIAYTAESAAQYDFPHVVSQYALAVSTALAGLDLHLLLEPGRAIVAPAGALISRVLYRKRNGAREFLIVDAAMNDLIRPSLYNAHHEIVPVKIPKITATSAVDVVGPVCETGDFFARDRELPPLAAGDLVAVLDAGAYGMSLASNYNTRGRAAEILVSGKKARLIRRRETVKTMLRDEEV